MPDPWAGLGPRFPWRPSQRSLLDALDPTDRCWHLCAPPGSGKTLVGLELARRVGGRTLVLSPTTAIRDQWCSATAMFGADPATFTSTSIDEPSADAGATADAPAPTPTPTLVSVTYQLLGNPGTASDDLRATARRMWERSVDDHGHRERIATLEATDPAAYQRELRSWIRTIRRSLADPTTPLPAVELLGRRATGLIERIAAAGFDTIVLDECHHLLDWWALVIDEAIAALDAARVEPVRIIGLTATLPEPGSASHLANYERILGEVDVTVPMAALVIDGELAPWRDAVWCVTPTGAERRFLDTHREHLDTSLDVLLGAEDVVGWVIASLLQPALDDRTAASTTHVDPIDGPGDPRRIGSTHWRALWNRDPHRAAALTGWWRHRGLALPLDVEPPGPTGRYSTWDRLELIWQYAHHPSCSPGRRRELRSALAEHGISLTTAGIRTSRRISDLVVSRSTAKFDAAGAILTRELDSRDGELCALVAVEADRAELPAAARDSLHESEGTMVRALSTIADHPAVLVHGIAAVSGRGLWIDALSADGAIAVANVTGHCPDGGWLSIEGTEHPKVVRLVESGSGWTTAHRVRIATALLDDGRIATLVGTRALLGEGWNHPPLDVLVDCSEAATANAVTQLRGRAVRLDPERPDKTVSLWDVVVCDDDARTDWARTRRKHQLWWGLDVDDSVSCGPNKLGAPLAAAEPPRPATLTAHNEAHWSRMGDRERTRSAWSGATADATGVPEMTITPRHRRRVTVDRPEHHRARRRHLIAIAVAAVTGAITVVAAGGFAWPVVVPISIALLAAGHLVRRRARLMTADDQRRWEAVGRALVAALDATGHTSLGEVEVVAGGHRDDTRTTISITATGPDAEIWVRCFHELLGPVGTPRWLLVVDDELWRVPTSIGASRAAAERFAEVVTTWFPRARLVRGGTDEATRLILADSYRRRDLLEIGHRWSPAVRHRVPT